MTALSIVSHLEPEIFFDTKSQKLDILYVLNRQCLYQVGEEPSPPHATSFLRINSTLAILLLDQVVLHTTIVNIFINIVRIIHTIQIIMTIIRLIFILILGIIYLFKQLSSP